MRGQIIQIWPLFYGWTRKDRLHYPVSDFKPLNMKYCLRNSTL